MYYCLYCELIRGRDSAHTCTFSINIQAHASMHAFTISRNVRAHDCTIFVHVTSMYALTQSSFYVLLRESMLIFLRACVSVHGLTLASLITVAFNHVFLLLCPTQSYEVTLDMDIGYLMSTLGVLSGISCIIARNFRIVACCNGFVKKFAYISPIGNYFSNKYPL